MSGLYAPIGLFAAVAITTEGDRDLPDGDHVRVVPSPLLGFPIAPMELFKVPAEVRFVEEVLWRDRYGNELVWGDLDAAGGYLTAEWAPLAEGVDVAVQLESDRTFEGTVSLLDPVDDRVLARNSVEPFQLAGPRVSRLRIEGRASRVYIAAWSVSDSMVKETIGGGEALEHLSLPVNGDRSWYAGGLGIEHSFELVKDGAPQCTTPADDPDGPASYVGPEDEVLRVRAFLDSTMERVESMLADPAVHPRQARVRIEAAEDGEPRQLVAMPACSTLLAQAMDPGHGRFLGLATTFHTVDLEPHAYVAAGLFAVDSTVQLPGGVYIAGALPDLTDLTDKLVDRNGARQVVDTIADTWQGDVVVRPLLAIAGVSLDPDLPTMPQLSLGRSRWLDASGEVSEQFSQEIVVDEAPLAALVALGRMYRGTWDTAHRQVELPAPADPSLRAVAMLMGRTGERAPLMPRGLLIDSPVNVGGGTRYRIRLADLFGRFGDATEIDAPDPDRPLPPAPAPQIEVVLDGPDGDDAGTWVSPGRVVARVPVPPIGSLVTGSVPITELRTVFDGEEILLNVPTGTDGETVTAEHEHSIRQLSQGEVIESTLQATFIDDLGREGPTTSVMARANDRRRPPIVVTGRGIIWTSRPGPSPEVELQLTWPAPAGTAYRAYVADATSLDLTGTTRADVARHGTDLDRGAGLGNRDHYRLLNDVPLTPVNGQVTMTELFPRSLSAVQFVRIVPVSDLGREAKFESCRAIPVAVPTDRRPPAPRVRATVDRGGPTASIVIEAIGLDLVALEAAEPGLFTVPPAAAAAPEFRVRRAMSPVSEPLYAPEIGDGRLALVETDAGPVFTATFEDPGPLPPYVRVSYWAEVRMPPERRLPRDVAVELPPAGGVTPVDPSQFEPMPAPYSQFSAPSTVTGRAGNTTHTLGGADATIGVDAGMAVMRLSATATPVAHPLAPRGFILRLWERWGSGDLTSGGPDVPLTGGPLQWTGVARPDPGDQPAALVYSLVAPDGQVGPQRELPAERETRKGLGG